ncbi:MULTISPECIES: caspase family protein [Trichocoleus]|uniref:Caspase family protein n=1 Tax=Trichocoleus desertorum GB2-A4 TaxID=2933944 RepID=A0ABV0J7N4_9CYAN|nr:caspase family protein [Trichocoleus sp. FACHB-46]MBD1863388.1 caspase family protein [Trichocoleus sp. FACHB-46]
MGLKRRAFLQQASLTLAALGMSEAGLLRLSDRYSQVLAAPTTRKLALLVGINQYPDSMFHRTATRSSALAGCVTDVELQRELLIHRFGFSDRDILTLSDRQATRQAIESAFLEHLTEQARPGDVVVFHFSGYGSRVQLGGAGEALQSSLVPVDGVLSSDDAEGVVNDLLEETLLLLLRSLPTDRVTTILDTSYLYPGSSLQGNLRLRARPKPKLGKPSPEELAFQDQLLSRIQASREQVGVQRRSRQIPGVVLAAASLDELASSTIPGSAQEQAFETQWGGFSAGLLTYALTQYLWSAAPAPTIQVSFNRATASVAQWVGQEQPTLMGLQSRSQALLTYYTAPSDRLGAEGIVISVDEDGRSGQLWLGGLFSPGLEAYGLNSVLTLVSPSSSTDLAAAPSNTEPSAIASGISETANALETVTTQPLQVQIYARNGLTAKARISTVGEAAADLKLQVGQLLQETVRVIPRHLNLAIALDPTLERIERVDATSAFSATPYITVVTVGEQPADTLLGRVSEAVRPTTVATATTEVAIADVSSSRSSESSVTPRSYGLFSASRELIPNSLGEGGEAVKSAIQRLLPHLKTRLAAKLLRLTANEASSHLGVKVALELVTPKPAILLTRSTLRANGTPSGSRVTPTPPTELGVPALPMGSQIRYQVSNYSDRPIYFVALSLDSSGSLIALYSSQATTPTEGSETKSSLKQEAIAPGESLSVPQVKNSLQWIVRGPAGFAETHLIFSDAPFTQTLAALEAAMRPMGEVQRLGAPSNPLEIAQAIWQDLHQASAVPTQTLSISTDMWALDVNHWATLSFLYQVVEKPNKQL